MGSASFTFFVVWVLWTNYSALQDEYGTQASERSKVTNPVDINVLLQKAIDNCDSKKNKSSEECDLAIESLALSLTIVDIEAQRSMAKSALGILHLNFWQILLNTLLFGAVGWTLYETRRTASNDIRRTELELQPFFDIEFVSCQKVLANGRVFFTFGAQPSAKLDGPATDFIGMFFLEIKIINKGQTPAGDIVIDFDATKSQFWLKDKADVTKTYPEVYSGVGRPHFKAPNFLIANESEITANFVVNINDTNGQKAFNQCVSPDVFHCSDVVIEDINIRYNDFSTTNTKSHKMVKANLVNGTISKGNDRTGGLLWSEKRPNRECEHYKK